MYLLINNKRFTSEDNNCIEKEINFTKIIKAKDNIQCYVNDNLYCTFKGIENWDIFSIENGEFTEEITKEEKLLLVNQQLSKQVNDLLIENKQNKQINKMLAQQINDINIKLNRGDL